MRALKKYLGSSIGRKQLMGATGIVWYLFLFVHLLGNVGLLTGPERFNQYGHMLLYDLAEFIIPTEIVLVAAILAHIFLAISLRNENKAARPVGYAVKANGGKKTFSSSTMMVTGTFIALYIIGHIAHFRFGAFTGAYSVTYRGVEMHDLYRTVMDGFAVWWYTLIYVAALLLIASHLAHGVQSSLQTLGFNHPKYTPAVQWLSRGYALFVCGGFIFLAVWAYFQHGGAH
jgi:succinate dehydrogenase / fumarate reductase cytochrome b subunit